MSSADVAPYFNDDFSSARSQFRAAVSAAHGHCDTYVHPLTGPDGGLLSTDVAMFGDPQAQRALVIVSGTHGVEGLLGSAAQIAMLDQIDLTALPVRVLFVHAINPWGFAALSRSNENNVDLNRNFIDWRSPPPANPGYTELHDSLCPAQWPAEGDTSIQQDVERWIEKNGYAAYIDSFTRGQYTNRNGVNYGGHQPEWSNVTLGKIVSKHLAGVEKIGLIDWHTGLGEYAEPFYLCFNDRSSAEWHRACNWWGMEQVDTQEGYDGAMRPNYTGLLFSGLQQFARQAEVTGGVIEFGTRPVKDMIAALKMDRHLRYGEGLDDGQIASFRNTVREAFCPSDPAWRSRVIQTALDIQRRTLEGVMNWR